MEEEAEEDTTEEEEMREETISRIRYERYELSRAHMVFRRRLEGKFKLISQ